MAQDVSKSPTNALCSPERTDRTTLLQMQLLKCNQCTRFQFSGHKSTNPRLNLKYSLLPNDTSEYPSVFRYSMSSEFTIYPSPGFSLFPMNVLFNHQVHAGENVSSVMCTSSTDSGAISGLLFVIQAISRIREQKWPKVQFLCSICRFSALARQCSSSAPSFSSFYDYYWFKQCWLGQYFSEHYQVHLSWITIAFSGGIDLFVL